MNINFKFDDKWTPRIVFLEAKIKALEASLISDDQRGEYQNRFDQFYKEALRELVKDHPHLLRESPELKDYLKA